METQEINDEVTMIYPLGTDKYKNMPYIGVQKNGIFMNVGILNMTSPEKVRILIEALETALDIMND